MKEYRTEDAFLELVRSGIWGRIPNVDYFKKLTEFDWLEIYMIAGKQTVLGICLKPILDLPDNLKPPTKLLLQWIGLNRYIEATNFKNLQVWKELESKFNSVGIHPVVVKGMTLARWYANPMSRQSSDIDIYVPEKFNEAIKLVKEWGLECKHKPQHDTIVYKGVIIEIHPRIFTMPYAPQLTPSYSQEQVVGNESVRVLDSNTTALLILAHSAGHFLIPGIGYRFLCDWAVFLKHNYDKVNAEFVLKEARKMGMIRFVYEFTKLAELSLGLNIPGLEKWTEGSTKKYTSKLSDALFECGDFGALNFQKNYGGNKFKLGMNILKSLLVSRYYWPKLFWRRTPKYLYDLIFKRFFVSKDSD